MKHWWVNHKQTFKEEYQGGYIWSPKTNKNGGKNQTYINLTLASPGDRIYSYASGKIQLIGLIEEEYRDAATPKEFGKVGDQWGKDGYLVRVAWTPLEQSFRPKDHIELIAPLLPEKHSPIQKNGNGNQSCYLAEINAQLSQVLLDIAQHGNTQLTAELADVQNHVREEEEDRHIDELKIPDTEKEQLRKSRVGQGLFRDKVIKIEGKCRVTGVGQRELLIASHIKPWRLAEPKERLDGNNGLLLSPHIDKLFDKGYISFHNDGTILLSKHLGKGLFASWGLTEHMKTGPFKPKQQVYLDFHREHIFKG